MNFWAQSRFLAPAAIDRPSNQPMAPSFGTTNSTGRWNAFFERAAEPLQYVAISKSLPERCLFHSSSDDQKVLSCGFIGILAGGNGAEGDGLDRIVAPADMAGISRIPQGLDRIRLGLDVVGIVGERGHAPDPGDAIGLAVGVEIGGIAQLRRQILP